MEKNLKGQLMEKSPNLCGISKKNREALLKFLVPRSALKKSNLGMLGRKNILAWLKA